MVRVPVTLRIVLELRISSPPSVRSDSVVVPVGKVVVVPDPYPVAVGLVDTDGADACGYGIVVAGGLAVAVSHVVPDQ